MQPLVSVIIPCYNVEKFVAKAVNSIIEQTYQNLDILIVDDASTDSTMEQIKRFQDHRIKIIEMKQNTRKIEATNTAIMEARGEYIAFQDADDWSEPLRIEMQINTLSNDPEVGICFTDFDIRTEKGIIIEEKGAFRDSDELIRNEFFHFMKDENSTYYKPSQCSTILVKSELLKQEKGYHPFFKGRVAEDVHLVYRILKNTKATAVKRKMYHFLRSSGSLTVEQTRGLNAKAAYSWELLSRIIEYEQKGIDILLAENHSLLNKIELEACELALVKTIQDKNALQRDFETSTTYKLGKFILYPFFKVQKIVKK